MEGFNIRDPEHTGMYTCRICGLHYSDSRTAEECEEWCRTNGTCNVRITSRSLESKEETGYRI